MRAERPVRHMHACVTVCDTLPPLTQPCAWAGSKAETGVRFVPLPCGTSTGSTFFTTRLPFGCLPLPLPPSEHSAMLLTLVRPSVKGR